MNSSIDPLVSIGMPVYNAEKYLRLALTSLLAQDYSHFELIISDNNSRDGTEQICREFAALDRRIRYIRQSENQGAPWNFKFVLEQARGAYFMWAAHDDFCAPSYLGKCLGMLQSHPEAVLCCTEVNFIDGEGNPSPYFVGFKNLETLGMTPAERIHQLIARMGWYAIYGLMRPEALRKLESLGKVGFGLDVVMTLELMLMGDIAKVHESLFFYRIVKAKTVEDFQADFNAENRPEAPTPMPYTELAASLFDVVCRSKLSQKEKLGVFADFLCTLSSPSIGWRNVITAELLGPNVGLNDAAFGFLLGQVLSRSVPLRELRSNPFMQALYRPPQTVPDILTLAKQVLGHEDTSKPQSPDHKHEKGATLFEQGQFEQASREFAEAIREHETSNLWTDWATAQLACQRTDKAESGLRRALELDAGNALAALKLGVLLANLGRAENAIPYLEMSAAAFNDQRRSEVLQLLADCRARIGVL